MRLVILVIMRIKSNPLTPLRQSDQFLVLRDFRPRIDTSLGVGMCSTGDEELFVDLYTMSIVTAEN